jgi:hypothetical protein
MALAGFDVRHAGNKIHKTANAKISKRAAREHTSVTPLLL